MSAAQTRALRTLAEPIVAALGCDLEDVVVRQAGKRRLVRLVVDHDGGLSLDLVADISRELSRALDETDLLGQAAYVLEVSSPGVDRPLRLPRHWARAVGRLVEVTPRSGERLQGRVVAADDEAATISVEGAERRVAYADVSRAVVQVEFTRLDEADLDGPDDGDEEA
jgi:ribosome maturation factor RimP